VNGEGLGCFYAASGEEKIHFFYNTKTSNEKRGLTCFTAKKGYTGSGLGRERGKGK